MLLFSEFKISKQFQLTFHQVYTNWQLTLQYHFHCSLKVYYLSDILKLTYHYT